MPAYFPEFRCKCGECRSVCCSGWRITIREAEYFRMMEMRCSDSLRERMDGALSRFEEPSPEMYAYISPLADGNCHFLDKSGLCLIHKECGEGCLPSVCRLYPRSIKPGEITEAVCSASCEKTVEILMDAPCPLPFITRETEVHSSIPPYTPQPPSHMDVRRDCLSLWQAKKPFSERFADLAERLGVKGNVFENDPKRALAEAVGIARTVGTLSVSLADILDEVYDRLLIDENADGVSDETVRRFAAAEAETARLLPDLARYNTAVLANHLFFVCFPYAEDDLPMREMLAAFYTAYVLLSFLTTAGAHAERSRDRYADIAAAVFRYIEHTDFYHNAPRILHRVRSALE